MEHVLPAYFKPASCVMYLAKLLEVMDQLLDVMYLAMQFQLRVTTIMLDVVIQDPFVSVMS